MKRNEVKLRSLGCSPLHLGNNSDNKWFRDQSRLEGNGPYHPSVARWPCSSWVLPTSLPVPRDQNSTFSNILQPASLIPRSKGTFCPSCKTETKRQLTAISPAFPVGWGSPLGDCSEKHINQDLVQALSSQDTVVPAEYVPGEATQGTRQKIFPTQHPVGSTRMVISTKQIQLHSTLAKVASF